MPESVKDKEDAIAGTDRRYAKAGVVVGLLLLLLSLVIAFPLLRAEVIGVKVALSVAGESAAARREAVGGSLYLVTSEAQRLLPPVGKLHLLTLAQAFGLVGSKVKYALYPRSVYVEDFGLPFARGTIANGDYILIYLPAAALNSRANVKAAAEIEAAMVRTYTLTRLFSERFDKGSGAYGALYRVGGAGGAIAPVVAPGEKSNKNAGGEVT